MDDSWAELLMPDADVAEYNRLNLMSQQINLNLVFGKFVGSLVLVVVFCAGVSCSAQSPAVRGQQRDESQPSEPWESQRKQELKKKENLQRQQEIKKDTDQLLALANELKQYVDKSSENTMSLDVIKKAEQIEKLAKTVKEKMKGPV